MADKRKISFTGRSGLLGSEFQKIRPDTVYPSLSEFNVRSFEQMREYVQSNGCELFRVVNASFLLSFGNDRLIYRFCRMCRCLPQHGLHCSRESCRLRVRAVQVTGKGGNIGLVS